MKDIIRKTTVTAVAATVCAASHVHAGPPVVVTFINRGTEAATYQIVSNNEVSTHLNASPKPRAQVGVGNADAYVVASTFNPDGNTAMVRYAMGEKSCLFRTSFVSTTATSPASAPALPQWNKAATASGGAICKATITAQDAANYAWNVEFTME